jgi:hypothetical protein
MKRTTIYNLKCGQTFSFQRRKYIVQHKNQQIYGGGAKVIDLKTGEERNLCGQVPVTVVNLHILTDKQLEDYVQKKIKEYEDEKRVQREQEERTDW